MRPVALRASTAIAAQVRNHLALEFSELGFAVIGENLGDRFFRACDDHRVAVDEAPSEAAGDERTDRAFPGGHEAGDDQFGRHYNVAARIAARPISSCGLAREIP